MKKIYFLILCVCCTFGSMAQMDVNANGRTMFGDYPWDYGVYIQDELNPDSIAYPTPFSIVRDKDDVVTFTRSPGGSALKMDAWGSITMGYELSNWGLPNLDNALKVIPWPGAASGVNVSLYNCDFTTGVLVGLNRYTWPFAATTGSTYRFYVDEFGTVYANDIYLSSDIALKKDIQPTSNNLDKLMKLRGVTYNLNLQKNELEPVPIDSLFKYAQKRTPGLTKEVFDQIQKEKSRKHFGVIAQEVEAVLPELVRTREDGLKAVAYPEMVAVLIEAIKEQQVQIEKQQLQIEESQAEIGMLKGIVLSDASLRSAANETETTGKVDPIVSQCKLYQNAPNPFSENTQINFYVSENVKVAQLCIYNLQGTQLKQILITQRGEGSQWISGSELSAGMYLYALIVDGKEVATKRMILTK